MCDCALFTHLGLTTVFDPDAINSQECRVNRLGHILGWSSAGSSCGTASESEEFTNTHSALVYLPPQIDSFTDEYLGTVFVENHFTVCVPALGERIDHIIKGLIATDRIPHNELHLLHTTDNTFFVGISRGELF